MKPIEYIIGVAGIVIAAVLVVAILNRIKRHMAKRRAQLAYQKLLERSKGQRAKGKGQRASETGHPSRFHY